MNNYVEGGKGPAEAIVEMLGVEYETIASVSLTIPSKGVMSCRVEGIINMPKLFDTYRSQGAQGGMHTHSYSVNVAADGSLGDYCECDVSFVLSQNQLEEFARIMLGSESKCKA